MARCIQAATYSAHDRLKSILPDFPTPIGVIRQIERPTYESLIQNQMVTAKSVKGEGSWKELLHGSSTWTVEAEA